MPLVDPISTSFLRKRAALLFWLILLALILLPPTVQGAGDEPPLPTLVDAPGLIIQNVGQFSPEIAYVVWGGAYPLWLGEDAVFVPVGDGMARISLAAGMGRPVGRDAMPTKVSFLRGADPAQWRSDVPVWASVRYALPGEAAGLTVTADGRLIAHGELVITGVDDVQVQADAIRLGQGGDTVSLGLGAPVLSRSALAAEGDLIYATLLRGSKNDEDADVAVDDRGQVILVGQSESTDFPTTDGVVGPGYAGGTQDVFVAKLAGDGYSLIFATFLGGTNSDLGKSVVVDADGNITVVGDTSSTDFPATPGAFFPTFNGGASDGFVAGLSPDGTQLRFSTFLGGNSYDFFSAIALAPSGDLILAGRTESTGFFVTQDAYDSSFNGGRDIFVTRMAADGSDILFSTFLGGGQDEAPGDLAVDALGNIFVGGYTWSSAFPVTPGAFDTTFNGGYTDAFVAKLSPDGATLDYATFLGGEAGEAVRGLAVDDSGQAVVTGYTASSGFPVTPGADGQAKGGDDAFVAKLLPDGSGLLFVNRFGGSGYDYGRGVGINRDGEILVAGETQSANFPTTIGAADMVYGGEQDLFVVKLAGDGSALRYGSYLGGSGDEFSQGLALDAATDQLYVAGSSNSADLGAQTVIGPGGVGAPAYATLVMKLDTPTRPQARIFLPLLAQ